MKINLYVGKMAAMVLVSMMLILVVGCSKKEAPSAPTNLTAVLNGDCIQLSWDKVPHADYYRITVGFQIIDENNMQSDEIYEVLLCETSDYTYNDCYPFDGINYYKIEAVNEYGSSSCSEVSCYYPINDIVFLFPNPAPISYSVGVIINPLWESTATNSINIYVESIQGQLVLDVVFYGNLWIDTSQLESGVYLAHLSFEDSEVVKRFVVVHE